MSLRTLGALACGGLQVLATTAYAVQGDPLPGIDVSMEQNPGGIIIAQSTTNGTETLAIGRGDFRFSVRLPDLTLPSSSNTAAIVLIVSSAGRQDNKIQVTAPLKSSTVVAIEFKTTASSSVKFQLSEGKPEVTPSSMTTARACLWASASYSQGAVFCVGPDTAIECLKPPEWVTKKSEACEKAAPIVPR